MSCGRLHVISVIGVGVQRLRSWCAEIWVQVTELHVALSCQQGAGSYDSDDEPSASHQPLARTMPRASAASAGAVADEAELVDRVCAPGALYLPTVGLADEGVQGACEDQNAILGRERFWHLPPAITTPPTPARMQHTPVGVPATNSLEWVRCRRGPCNTQGGGAAHFCGGAGAAGRVGSWAPAGHQDGVLHVATLSSSTATDGPVSPQTFCVHTSGQLHAMSMHAVDCLWVISYCRYMLACRRDHLGRRACGHCALLRP
jgi:hypothetical protein